MRQNEIVIFYSVIRLKRLSIIDINGWLNSLRKVMSRNNEILYLQDLNCYAI